MSEVAGGEAGGAVQADQARVAPIAPIAPIDTEAPAVARGALEHGRPHPAAIGQQRGGGRAAAAATVSTGTALAHGTPAAASAHPRPRSTRAAGSTASTGRIHAGTPRRRLDPEPLRSVPRDAHPPRGRIGSPCRTAVRQTVRETGSRRVRVVRAGDEATLRRRTERNKRSSAFRMKG